MHAMFVTLWLQVMQPLASVHETKWTPHVKWESDVAQSYTSSASTICFASLLFFFLVFQNLAYSQYVFLFSSLLVTWQKHTTTISTK